jgi:DNA invertase Pin-like site-specific DNA recombinase
MDQDASMQVDALKAAGCNKIFTDTTSGTLTQRPELDQLLTYARPGDTLIVWRLDRLGRSLKHLIELTQQLNNANIGLRSLQETLDTTSPGGKLVFHVFAALAEFERQLIIERTKAGLTAARARGRQGGRPTKLTPNQRATAHKLYNERTMTVKQIGEILGVSRTTIYRHLNQPPTSNQ